MPKTGTRSPIVQRQCFTILRGGMYFRFYILLIILCVAASLIEGRPRTLKKCGRRNSKMARIVGGTATKPGEYPWMVSVHIKEGYRLFEHACGGTILNEHYVLTAAHCVNDSQNPSQYQIFAGVHQLSKRYNKPAMKYKVTRLIVHEDYADQKNDIALIRTEKPIDIEGTSGYINGICLPYNSKDPSGWALVSGWGFTKENFTKIPDTLNVVKVPLLSRELCKQAYEHPVKKLEDNYTISDTHICASIYKRDACQADSGGPLMQRNEKGVYTQIGIVSFGEGCARKEFPGVYTKVASYLDWLEENMKEE